MIPISFKLISITVGILLAVTVTIAFQSSESFIEDKISTEEQVNQDQASARAQDVEGLIISIIDKLKMTGDLVYEAQTTGKADTKSLDLTFREDRDLVSVEVLSTKKVLKRIVNDKYLKQYNLAKDYIDQVRAYQDKEKKFQTAAVFAGQIEIRNATLEGGAPLITIGVPLRQDDYGKFTDIVVGDIRMDRIQDKFANEGTRFMYLVDKDGFLLAHPDENLVFGGTNMASHPVVKASLDNQVTRTGQKRRFLDPNLAKDYTGAYSKTALGLTVVSQAALDVILEGAKQLKLKAFKITGQGLSVALFVIFIFSITLTAPIEKLVDVSKEIAKGNFDIKSNIKSRDEVGALASAFDSMVEGLQERDKVKNVLNKFHGSSIADDMLKGDLSLGGSRKAVTVFFSDIRGFTKFSEGHTAEEVVDMLNEYFEIMVGIIQKYDGVVDKFIGDAIMAVWGAPEAKETDQINALRACIEMRKALDVLNKIRIERGQPAIMIGMGLHSGDAISGTIGSDARMEYTVIGDAVNVAARIEASTKAFGADLLVSDAIVNLVKDNFILEMAGRAEVKGKAKPLELYKCRGYVEDGQEFRIKTEYSDFEPEAADKVKVAS